MSADLLNLDTYNNLSSAKASGNYNVSCSTNSYSVTNPISDVSNDSIFENQSEDDKNASDSLNEEFEQIQNKQGFLGKLWNGFKNLTGLGLGSNDVEEKIEQCKQGEITYDVAKEAIQSYEDKQEGAVDIITNTVSGIATAGFAAATGGIGAIAAAAMVGGAVKAGMKTVDRATNNVEDDAIDIKQIAKDGITGAVDGAVSALTAGLIKGTAAGQTVKQAVKNGAVQGAVSGSISGAATGACEYSVNSVLDDEEFSTEDLLKVTAQNAVAGAVFGGILGGVTNGISQSRLNRLIETDSIEQEAGKLKVSHSKTLSAEIDNQTQASQYLENYNENAKLERQITGEVKDEEEEILYGLSKKSESLAKTFDSQIDEAAQQIDEAFGDKSQIEVITARSKGQKSIFSKLSKKEISGKMKTGDMTECYDTIGDALGIRIQMKSLDSDTSKEIVEKALSEKGINATYNDFVKFLQGANDELDDSIIEAFETSGNEILDSLKTAQTQNIVDQLADNIREGKVQITEINNYGDEVSSYFTDSQLHQLVDAYNDAVLDEKIVNNPLEITNRTIAVDASESKINPNGEEHYLSIEIRQKTKGATKESGYTSSQMNTKHILKDGTTGNGELQIRGVEVNAFADVEHIPYDIRTGKISKFDAKYCEIYDLIKNGLDDTNYKNYNKYLSDTYKSLRMKELGLWSDNMQMPDISSYLTGLSDDVLDKLSTSGLIKISRS